MIPQPEVTRYADGWRFCYKGLITLQLTSIRDSSREGFHARVDAFTPERKLGWDVLKLDSSRSRSGFAKDLASNFAEFDWTNALAQMAEVAMDLYREGEALVWLDEGQAPGKLEYLVDPLLPANQTAMLYADGKSGKSLLALWLASAVTLGMPRLPGMHIAKPSRVLYLDWEADAGTFLYRLQRLAQGLDLKRRPRIAYQRVNYPLRQYLPRIQQLVDDQHIDLVIIDSLGFALGDDMNDGSVAATVMNSLRSIRATRLVLHHITNDAAKASNGDSRPFGSVYFRNAARTLWELRTSRSKTSNTLALYSRAQNDGEPIEEPLGFRMEFLGKDGPVVVSGCSVIDDPNLGGYAALPKRVEWSLRDHGPATTGELAERLGEEPRAVAQAARRNGNIVQLGDAQRGRGHEATWSLKGLKLVPGEKES